jgi:hypothetical protein
MKKLSSIKSSRGNKDYWWYDLSSPDDWITTDASIIFILNNSSDLDRIGSILLRLSENDWLNRIKKASYHFKNGNKTIKVHITKEHSSQQYMIYFGRKDDGVYPVTVKNE